jgi:hypothetical protein
MNRYLLYIDILGFSHYVQKDTLQVHRIYKIIEDLNAHHHDSFRVIVFSDTVLIYNLNEPLTESEKNYYVMFLIEFAQNLLYEFSGKKLFFRALLVQGDFEHIISGRFEKFFGKALIRAYLKEKSIKCCGLFIDRETQKNNNIFPVAKHDKDVYFVYMNQSLDAFCRGELGEWPVDPDLMYQTDSQWHLAQDVYFLRDVYDLMTKHSDSGVRLKMRATWEYYEKRYPLLLRDLASNQFSLSVLSAGFDWTDAISRVTEGFRGFSQDLPSMDELSEIIAEAKRQGTVAATAQYKAIYGETKPGQKFFAPCGGGMIVLDVDGRSRLGRLLKKAAKELPDFSLLTSHRGGYVVFIQGMHSCQEREVDVAASKAALAVLIDRLGIIGHVREYYD